MAWKKWADTAVKYKIRIENWPVALKATFPSEGFELGHINGKGATEAFKEAWETMKKRYEGGEEGGEDGGIKIVSWTEDECELDDLADICDVPLVICDDGTTLSSGKSSKALLRKIEDVSDTQVTTNAKAGPSQLPKKRKALQAGDETRPSKKPKPTSSTRAATPDNDDGSRISTTNAFKCRYINSEVMSGVFATDGFDEYTGPPSNIDKHTLVLDLTTSEWHPCPAGFRPRVDKGTSAVLRSFINLTD
ncbi:hypothetical protein DFH09DRAFT_1092021 [Mycena vulgaris]|nr:hypothetical protein DFH09DRAFT_1092021 [Mycena vulgaris]